MSTRMFLFCFMCCVSYVMIERERKDMWFNNELIHIKNYPRKSWVHLCFFNISSSEDRSTQVKKTETKWWRESCDCSKLCHHQSCPLITSHPHPPLPDPLAGKKLVACRDISHTGFLRHSVQSFWTEKIIEALVIADSSKSKVIKKSRASGSQNIRCDIVYMPDCSGTRQE